MSENKCNLEVINRDGSIICRAICAVHFMEDRCCRECNESLKCKKVCGFVRDQRKTKGR